MQGARTIGFGQSDAYKEAVARKKRLAAAKRKREEWVVMNAARQRTAIGYVPRTPGGQVVADNHYFDAELAATAVAETLTAWTGSEYDPIIAAGPTPLLCLFAPTQGNDISQRDGRKVFLKKLRITGQLVWQTQTAQATIDEPGRCRIIVYQDKQTNGAQSQGEQLIASGAALDAINMFQSTLSFGRFKVLKDKMYSSGNQNNGVFGPSTGALIGQTGAVINFHYNLKINEWVNYNATNGGTVADVIDNSWHLIANSEGDTTPALKYKVRGVFSP